MAALPPTVSLPPPPPPPPPALPGGVGGSGVQTLAQSNIAAIEATHSNDHVAIVGALEAKINEVLEHTRVSFEYKRGVENGQLIQEVYSSITGEALFALRANEVAALTAREHAMLTEEERVRSDLVNSQMYRDLLAELQRLTSDTEKQAKSAGILGDLSTIDLATLVLFRKKLVEQYRDYHRELQGLQRSPDHSRLLEERKRQHQVELYNVQQELRALSGAPMPVPAHGGVASTGSADYSLPRSEIQEYCAAWARHQLAASKLGAPGTAEVQIVEELSEEQRKRVQRAKELIASHNGDQGSRAASALEYNKERCLKLNRERIKEISRGTECGLSVSEQRAILEGIDAEIFEAVVEIKRLQAELSEYTIVSKVAEAKATVESMKSFQIGNLVPKTAKKSGTSGVSAAKSGPTTSQPKSHLTDLSALVLENCPEAYMFSQDFYSRTEMAQIARAIGITNLRETAMMPTLIKIFQDASKPIPAGINGDVQRHLKTGDQYTPAEFIQHALHIDILSRQAQIKASKEAGVSSSALPRVPGDTPLLLPQGPIEKLAEETDGLNKDLQALHDRTRMLEQVLKTVQAKLRWAQARNKLLKKKPESKFFATVNKAQYATAREKAEQYKKIAEEAQKKQDEIESFVKTEGPQALLAATLGKDGARQTILAASKAKRR